MSDGRKRGRIRITIKESTRISVKPHLFAILGEVGLSDTWTPHACGVGSKEKDGSCTVATYPGCLVRSGKGRKWEFTVATYHGCLVSSWMGFGKVRKSEERERKVPCGVRSEEGEGEGRVKRERREERSLSLLTIDSSCSTSAYGSNRD